MISHDGFLTTVVDDYDDDPYAFFDDSWLDVERKSDSGCDNGNADVGVGGDVEDEADLFRSSPSSFVNDDPISRSVSMDASMDLDARAAVVTPEPTTRSSLTEDSDRAAGGKGYDHRQPRRQNPYRQQQQHQQKKVPR